MIVQSLQVVALSAILLLSPARTHAQDARDFSIHPSDGRAALGQQPLRDDDQRTAAREDPELWLRASPIVVGGVQSVRVAPGYQGRPIIWLTLTEAARKKVVAYTASHVGQRLAYVLDGEIVGREVTISTPLLGHDIAISTDQGLEAAQRLAGQLSATVASPR